MTNDTPPPIAIIGAGVSGLACARFLQKQGRPCILFDKGRRPGGRASTRIRPGASFDHGAQYFTARDDRFRAEVSRWAEAGMAARWDPRMAVISPSGVRLKRSKEKRYVGTPEMTRPFLALAEQLHVVNGITVGALSRRDEGWELLDAAGSSLGTFAQVVLSTPAPQAAALLEPVLPELAQWAREVTMAPCWAVMVQFETPLFAGFDAAFVEGLPLSWVARNSSKPERPPTDTWVLHAAPDWSREHEEDEARRVGPYLLEVFFDALEQAPFTPSHLRAHRWRYALADQPAESGYVYHQRLGVGICGDWCNGSRIEGAYLSGLELGERIAAV